MGPPVRLEEYRDAKNRPRTRFRHDGCLLGHRRFKALEKCIQRVELRLWRKRARLGREEALRRAQEITAYARRLTVETAEVVASASS